MKSADIQASTGPAGRSGGCGARNGKTCRRCAVRDESPVSAAQCNDSQLPALSTEEGIDRGAGASRRNVRVPACGEGFPLPSPDGDIPTVHCTGDPGIEPAVAGSSLPAPPENRCQHHPLARLPTGYRHALPPPPGAGEEREARAGWGLPERIFRLPFCPGRGRAPSPVPSPDGDVPTVQCTGTNLEDPDPGRLSPALRKTAASTTPWHGFPLDIATHCPRPPGGGGARSAGGVGATEAAYGYPPAKRGWGGGYRSSVRVSPCEGRVGWGDRGGRSVGDGTKAG